MRYLTLIILISLFACGSDNNVDLVEVDQADQVSKVKIPKISAELTNNPCAWWRQPNQDFNGVPKYSGSFCTYTHKHIPMASYGNGEIFYTTTTLVHHGTETSANGDVGADTDFLVFAHKGEEKQLVHKIEHWSDPHTNAAIQVDNEGYVRVHVASRGLSFKFQSGKILKSKTPYELDFECVGGCSENDVNFEAYPQVFDTDFGYYVGYTHYVKDPEIHPSRNIREIWYRIGDTRTRLAEGAHYQNTYYHNGKIYVAFNYLKDGWPETRYNLYGLKTSDGINWTTFDNEPVTLPIEQDSEIARIYETESKENNVYLKDMTFKLGIRVLFTEATTNDPTQGERHLSEYWNHDDEEYPKVKVVRKTNHNYSSGAYVEYDHNTYVLGTLDNGVPYLGGDVGVFKVFSHAHKLIGTLSGNYSYIRKVYGMDGKAVAGEGVSDVYVSSEHVILSLAD